MDSIFAIIVSSEFERTIQMTFTDLQAAIPTLSQYQIEQISAQVARYMKLNEELMNTRPEVCPICGESEVRFIKKGVQAGKQRYQCKGCGHKFTYDTKQITSNSHQPVDSWITVIEDTLSMAPINETAGKIAVCHETAFNMRHKLLAYLESMINTFALLDELIEADETYVPESQKGIKCVDRKPRKHGEGTTKRGLSNEQYCVCVATDRNDNLVATCVNRAKPSGNDLVNALSAHIVPQSVLLCDGATAYNKLADKLECKKIELVGHESYDRLYHLNTVNSLHSRIKAMFRQFRGVASKYLNRYLALFTVIVSFAKCTITESADDLRRSLSAMRENVTYISSQSEGLLAI